jgi:hypothetical protein
VTTGVDEIEGTDKDGLLVALCDGDVAEPSPEEVDSATEDGEVAGVE